MGIPKTLTRTTMFTRKTPGGKFNVVNEALTTGNIFYVDSGQTTTGGTGAGFGREPDKPFTTLTAALAQCTASNGDYIFLMPGHSEAPVATITVNVIGVTIVGLGNGTNRPTFTPAHTAADDTFDITVASVTIKNIYIATGTNSTGNTIQLNVAAGGDDFTMEGCTIGMGDKNLIGITVATTADRGTLKNMKIIGTAANPDTIIHFEGTAADWTIDGLDGLFGSATDIDGPVIYQNSGAAGVMENLLLRNIRVVPIAAAGVMLDFNSASTGIAERVLGYTLATTIGELVDAGALLFFDTKFGGAAKVGVQYPSTTIVS